MKEVLEHTLFSTTPNVSGIKTQAKHNDRASRTQTYIMVMNGRGTRKPTKLSRDM